MPNVLRANLTNIISIKEIIWEVDFFPRVIMSNNYQIYKGCLIIRKKFNKSILQVR